MNKTIKIAQSAQWIGLGILIYSVLIIVGCLISYPFSWQNDPLNVKVFMIVNLFKGFANQFLSGLLFLAGAQLMVLLSKKVKR